MDSIIEIYENESDPILLGNLITEMIQIVNHCFIYVDDYTRGDKQKIPAEYWSIIGTFTSIELVGCDCEDMTTYNMTLIYMFQHLEIPSNQEFRPLYHIQQQLNKYTPIITFGLYLERKNQQKNYSGHAYIILLNSIRMDNLLQENNNGEPSLLSPIIIDGCEYATGCWDETYFHSPETKTDIELTFKADEFIAHLPLTEQKQWNRIIRTRCPSYMFAKEKMYGDVTVLLIPNHQGKAYHLLCTSGKDETQRGKWKIGLSLERLFHTGNSSNIINVAEMNQENIQYLTNEVLREFPRSHLPVLSRTNHDRSIDNDSHLNVFDDRHIRAHLPLHDVIRKTKTVRFCLRTIDYKARKDEIDKIISSMSNYRFRIPTLTISISDDDNVSYTEFSVII
jgi:hypothetical protein